MTRARLALAAAVVMLAAGCYYGDPGAATQPEGQDYGLIGFTADGSDSYSIVRGPGQTTVTAAPSNTGGNTRVGFIVEDGDHAVNESCATWASHSGPIDQPGAVVHFDGTRGFTATQNIWAGYRSAINVHFWDLSQPTSSGYRFQMLHQFVPPGIGAGNWPLRMCMRAAGPFLDVKVWPTSVPEPAYGDPSFSSGLLIGPPHVGRAGWFAGHLPPGGTLVFQALTVANS